MHLEKISKARIVRPEYAAATQDVYIGSWVALFTFLFGSIFVSRKI